VLDAIREGNWDYEPEMAENDAYKSTKALPGSNEKLHILAERIKRGLPLWHPNDRRTYDDTDLD
jgi:hypothetical protein